MPKRFRVPKLYRASVIYNWREEILAYFDHHATNAYNESVNSLIFTTNRVGRGYSFEALRAKVLLSEGPELSRDLDIETTMHSMRVPTRYEGRFGTLLSTLPQILGDASSDPDQP